MSKRRFEETQQADDGFFEIRVLISKYEGSVIIGKGGDNVKNIRTETHCYVSVRKTTTPAVKDRVLTVKGLPENIAKALFMIAQLLVDAAAAAPATASKKKSLAQPGELTIKILIHKFIAGCILGKGGAIIKEIQDTTKARLGLSTDMLPASTEKVLSITGTPEVLHAAVERVVQQLVANPLRPGSTVSPYVPGLLQTAFVAPNASPFGFGAPMGMGGVPQMGGFGMAPQADSQIKTEKIVIPSVCGSMLIGKGGSVIRDIKTQSGTTISLHKPAPEAKDDQIVSITGTMQGIQAAVFLIRQRVDQYAPPA